MQWPGWRCVLLLLWCGGTQAGRWVEVELDDLWSGDSGGYYYGGDGGGGGYGGYGGGYGGQRRILERISSTSSGRHLQGWPGGPGGPPGGGGGSLPTMRHTIVFDERSKEAIVYGGTTKDNTVSGEVFLYNMSSRTWRFKLMTFGPTSRYGHSACFDPIGRKMWVYGGVGSDASYQSDLWSFDTESLEWSVSWSLGPAGGIGQAGHSAVWDIQKTRMYIFGPFMIHVWYYDSQADSWTKANSNSAQNPARRKDHTAVWDPVLSKMWLYGGRSNAAGTFGDFWVFSTEGDNFRWAQRAEVGPSARWGHNAAWDESRLGKWVFAGMDDGGTALQDLWFYDSSASSWNLVVADSLSPPSRYQAASVWARGDFWVHGGADQNGTGIWDFWYYMPYAEGASANRVAFNVTSGDCVAIGHCVKSPNYPLPYGPGSCTISAWPGMRIYALDFQTKGVWDNLTISNETFSLDSWPHDTIPEGEITWTAADWGGMDDRWLLCGYDFTVNSGSCSLSVDGCVHSPNFPNQYDTKACEITPRPGMEVKSISFQTEQNWDRLRLNGVVYSGSSGPQGIIATGEPIHWQPDQVGQAAGWELCASSVFSVLQGNCTVEANCVESPQHSDEGCIIAASGRIPVRSAHFDLEVGSEFLSIGYEFFWGNQGPFDDYVEGPILWTPAESSSRGSSWKLCRAPFTLIDGNCNTSFRLQDCVSSPNFPEPYDNNGACSILPQHGMMVAAVDFQTESLFDYLAIESIRYSGTDSPQNVEVFQPIAWLSNAQTAGQGWQLCRVCESTEAPGSCVCQRGYEAAAGACQQCRPGYFKKNASFIPCLPCPGGTASTAPGALACAPCGVGEYSSPGAAACELCPAGRYAIFSASPVCTECEQGTYSTVQGASGPAVCVPCPEGSTTLRGGANASSECIGVNSEQLMFCTSGRPCVITGVEGRALKDGHLMAITSELSCTRQKVPVPRILNTGISQEAEQDGSRYQWGTLPSDFQPAGGVYSLCLCPNLGAIACRNLNEGFLLLAGQLQVLGPVPGTEFHCVRGQICEVGPVRGFGFSTGDGLVAQRASCGSEGSVTPIRAGITRCTNCTETSDPAMFGQEAEFQLNLGVFVEDPDSWGYYLCWCSGRESNCENPGDFNVEAARILVSGPFSNQELHCASGQVCTLPAVRGLDMQIGDRLMILPACGMGSSLHMFPGEGTLELGAGGFQFVFEPEIPLEAEPGIYRVCYCRPWSGAPCESPSDFLASVGLMTVRGPLSQSVGCWMNQVCHIALVGLELGAGDLLSLAFDCHVRTDMSAFGLLSGTTEVELAPLGEYTSDFGVLGPDVTPGHYEVCWCPRNGNCTDPTMRAHAGSLSVMCPPGYFSVGSMVDSQSGRRCVRCPPGFYCPGGLPTDARKVQCPLRQSTQWAGRSSPADCVCDMGYFMPDMIGSCQVCPLGTFKDQVTDDLGCTPCPTGQTTYQTGAVDQAACTDSTGSILSSAIVPAAVFRLTIEHVAGDDAEDADEIVQYLQNVISVVTATMSGVGADAVVIEAVSSLPDARRLDEDDDGDEEPGYGDDGDDADGDDGDEDAGDEGGDDGDEAGGDDGDDGDDGDGGTGNQDPGDGGATFPGFTFDVTVRYGSSATRNTFVSNFVADALLVELAFELSNAPELSEMAFVSRLPLLPQRTTMEVVCEDGTSTSPGKLVLSPLDCECSPGYGRNVQFGICEPCPRGTFKESIGNSLCRTCPEQRTTGGTGASNFTECLCQAGLYAAGGTCQLCPDNFFCSGHRPPQPCGNNSVTARPGARLAAECICMAGHFSATRNDERICDECPSGRYKPNLGDEPCGLNCPANSDSLPGATSPDDCFCRAGYHAIEVANSSLLEICLACNYRGLSCSGGRENVTANETGHAQPVALPGYYQTGNVVAVACDVNMADGLSACRGGNLCAEGSGGLLCGECPQGYARDQYPNYCRTCPDNPSVWVGMVILLDLFQKTFLNFVVAAMAAMSAIKDSDNLHTSMIRIGTQWMTACSVISYFSIDQLAVFSWEQEQAELEHKQNCAEDNSCAEAVAVVTYDTWPNEVTEWLRQVFNILDVVSKLTSVPFMTHCHAAAQFSGDRVALLVAPGIYFLSLPALAVLNTFLLCAFTVYAVLPCLRRHGWEFNEAGKKKQKREKALKLLKKALADPLQALGLTFEDLEASGVLSKLALLSLQHGTEEPEPFVAGILELSVSLSVRACLLQVREDPHFVTLLDEIGLSWEDCVENAADLATGLDPAGLSHAARHRTLRKDKHLREALVKRALVWKRRDIVKEAVAGDLREVSAAVADAYTVRALITAAAEEELFRALVLAQVEKLRQEAEENGEVAIDGVFSDDEGSAAKEVDLETLDLGLFTKSPGAARLFHQCIPVIWVTLINMWPGLLSQYLQMIWCKPVSGEEGVVMRLQPHPDVECWTGDHLPIAYIAIIGLSVWCIGIPLLLYLAIWRLKDRNTQENYRTYGYFIDGFEPAYWWWDILIKRGDVAIMMLVTYTSVADDEKAKLLIYPFISGGHLAITAWCRPFLNNQAEILDFLEYILSSFRFLFFSGIALLLIFHSQDTLWAMASVLVSMLVLMCLYFALHVIAQVMRKASKDMQEEDEEEATADFFKRQSTEEASTPSKADSPSKEEPSAAIGCTGKIKRWIVNHALPLVQESQDEKYLMEWCVESDSVNLITAAPAPKRSKFATMIKKLRAWLLRFGSSFQRQVVAKALQEFATLWLELFKQDGLPTKTLKVLALLTTAKSRVPARTPKKDIPDLWKNQVKVVLATTSPAEEPRMYRFSPEELIRTTQRLGLLEVEDAVELVNGVVELLRAERAGRPSVHIVPHRARRGHLIPALAVPPREVSDVSFNTELLNLVVAEEGGGDSTTSPSKSENDLFFEDDGIAI